MKNYKKMTDNIQEFNKYFAYIIEGIVQDLHYFPSYYLILEISFVFNIISLKNCSILQRENYLKEFVLLNLSKSVEKLRYVQG